MTIWALKWATFTGLFVLGWYVAENYSAVLGVFVAYFAGAANEYFRRKP
jgi:hypothetical protein